MHSTLPVSSVPSAFDRGHLYSPALDLTTYALDDSYDYDYLPGTDFEPMPPAPRGNPKAWTWWWVNIALTQTPDFLGLTSGRAVTLQHACSTGPGTVVKTHRTGAIVRYPMPHGSSEPYAEMLVRRRNQAGHWY